jgi:hypothetical protein
VRPRGVVAQVTLSFKSPEVEIDPRMHDALRLAVGFQAGLGGVEVPTAAIDEDMIPRLLAIRRIGEFLIPLRGRLALKVDGHDDPTVVLFVVLHDVAGDKVWLIIRETISWGNHGWARRKSDVGGKNPAGRLLATSGEVFDQAEGYRRGIGAGPRPGGFEDEACIRGLGEERCCKFEKAGAVAVPQGVGRVDEDEGKALGAGRRPAKDIALMKLSARGRTERFKDGSDIVLDERVGLAIHFDEVGRSGAAGQGLQAVGA